ncbi:hypothetical protein KIPB_012962, partial [Kipferlia bialata]
NKCAGICPLGSDRCLQTSSHGKCGCTSEHCTYDYATNKCSGLCPTGQACNKTGSHSCSCGKYGADEYPF